MKREYIKLWSFICAATLILTAVLLIVSHFFKSSRQEEIDKEYEIIDEINKVNETFKEKVEEYSTKKEQVDKDLAQYVSYYTGMYDDYDKIANYIRNLENYVIDVENSSVYLNKNCIDKIYSNKDTNAKCIAYISNFEKTVNTYVSSVIYFNKKIDEYNDWLKAQEDANKNKELDKFESSKYKDFIDVNGDGSYLGKSE